MLRRLTVFFCMALLLSSFRVQAEETDDRSVNVFVYMIGSDLESMDSQATGDLREMLAGIGKTPKELRLLLYGGGSTDWKNKYFTGGENSCYYIDREGTRRLFENERVSMGKAETLASFLKRAGEQYPAARNILILWDHGGGALGGFGMDNNFPTAPSMSLRELKGALDESDLHFDLIGFDACQMSTAETAWAVSPFADYLLAPECMSSGLGLRYDEFLAFLGKNPAVSTRELGEYMCEGYLRACEKGCPEQSAGLSLIDLQVFSRQFPEALNALSRELEERVRSGDYASAAKARMNVPELGGEVQNDAIDLYSFCELWDTEAARGVTEALDASVCCANYRNMPRLGGVSLVLPFHSPGDTDKYLDICKSLDFCEPYRSFVSAFNAVEVCGQVAQGDGMGFLRYLRNGKDTEKSILTAEEIREIILRALDGALALGTQELNANNIGFLREAFSDRAFLDAACAYAAKNSFRSSRIQWVGFGWGKNVIRSFGLQEKLVGQVYQELMLHTGETTASLGWIPLEKRGFLWLCRVDHWYALGDGACVVYSLNGFRDGNENKTEVLIPAALNGVSGYLTALLSEEGESAVTGFMVGYERENYGLWGKIIPVSGFRPTDSIVLYSALSRRTGELFTEAETQISQQWGKGLHLKQFSLPADGQYSVCYRVCDIYDRYHILSREP